MTVNQSGRFINITVGGSDFSPALLRYVGSDSKLEQSGFITHSGTLELIPVEGLNESLDDRRNPCRWQVGQPVLIDVQRTDGSFKRHPRGNLQIISAEFNDDERKLVLKLGCLLSLLNFKHPIDITDLQREEGVPDPRKIEIGVMTPRANIVRRLLELAGITAIADFELPNPINYPLEIGGSYLETVGKLLYSTGHYGWIDRDGVFRVSQISLQPISQFTFVVGQDELWYRRLSNPEGPREVIKTTGVTKLAKPIQPPQDGAWHCRPVQEKIGPAKVIAPNLLGNAMLLRVEVCEKWEGSTLVTQTKTWKPAGLAIPDYEFSKATPIIAELRIERKEYEDATEGKLLRHKISIARPAGLVLDEYLKATETVFAGETLPLEAEVEIKSYSYDCRRRIVEITTQKEEAIATILKGINHDWSTFLGTPIKLWPSELFTESWNPINKNEWERVEDLSQSYARAYPEAITEETSTGTKLTLAFVERKPYRSNSGQETPQGGDRKPGPYTFEDRQVRGEAKFTLPCGPNLSRERERSYQVDFLEGLTGEVQNHCGNDDASNPQQQLNKIAELEGAILIGRHKGQEIGLPLSDFLLDSWFPLMGCSAIEWDGAERVYLLDGVTWGFEPNKAICNFDGVWVGDRKTAQVINQVTGELEEISVVDPPYTSPDVFVAGSAIGIQLTEVPYDTTTPEIDVFVAGLAIGATGIETAPPQDTFSAGLAVGAIVIEDAPPEDTFSAGLAVGAKVYDFENDIFRAGLAAGVRGTDEQVTDEFRAGLAVGTLLRDSDGVKQWAELSEDDWRNLTEDDWRNLE